MQNDVPSPSQTAKVSGWLGRVSRSSPRTFIFSTVGLTVIVALVLLIQFFCLPGPRSEDNRAGQESK